MNDTEPAAREVNPKYFEKLEPTETSTDPSINDFALIQAEIGRLGLERHVQELEASGYTVVPPEKVAHLSS